MPPPSTPEVTLTAAVEGISRPPGNEASHLQAWRDAQGEIFALCYEAEDLHWICWPGLAGYCLDTGANRVAVHPEPNADPSLVLDTYRRSVLPIVQHVLGRESLHASAVLGPQGVVAFCGESMAGKSTIAYGLSERGYGLWADDAVTLEITVQSATAVPFPFSLRLRPSAASHFGLSAESLTQSPNEPDVQGTERQNTSLAAVFVLERLPEDGPVRAVGIAGLVGHEALTRLLPHARCFSLKDVERKRQMMTNYLTLVNRVPVYRIGFQAGLDRLSVLLDRIEQSLGPASEAT